ncbi:acetylxylan esterase [Mangrovihabitans endophyticus]|uniref:Acetylxylan esterase n=1 Tax=Mangrovihabitans endophyticus TaxID=1751298 RepID=A0A8J3C2F5_9ACTN|nr:acetylxylan esterase [Mangrovihabitans endophyticus]GGL00313.1 acetylxylan esterase [Mangrovihabitans endophyticus]
MAVFDLPLHELTGYTPEVSEPPDFDEFWRRTRGESDRDPAVLSAEAHDCGLRLVRTWDVTFAGFGGDPVRAWFTRPAHAEPDEPLPVVVEFPGYGRGRGLPHERLTWPTAGYAHLLMDTRGQDGHYGDGGDTPDPRHDALGGPGPVTRGILAPDDYYYRRLITDAVRAVQAARTLPGVDPERTAAAGNSQGGGLALAVAGLVPDLAAAVVTAPFLCHITRALDISDADPYRTIAHYLSLRRADTDRILRTLSYVDGVHFARRARAPLHLGLGLRDTTCPPSTVFAAYNHYGRLHPRRPDTTVEVYPYNGHEAGGAFHVPRQLRWLAKHLDPAMRPG